tara:strand:- start:610 stop:1791 length:1182 start_codon:yes stop_codon:yes gene_type:complete
MANWKKVVVSGSAISQFDNDSGYITSVTAQHAFTTASFNGTELLADSAQGELSFASSSGQGLNISANAGTDTLTFGLDAIPNTSLASSTISGKALGTNLDDLTIGSGLAASSAYNGSAARTAAVGAGTHITVNTNDVAVNTTTLIAAISGSILSTIAGDVVVDVNGVSTIQANSVALGTDTTGDYVQNLGTGTGVTIGSNTGEGSQPTIAVDYGSSANNAVEGDTTITLTQTSGEIDITGTAAQALGGGPSYTIGLADTITGDRTFSNNIVIGGDLTVSGTASFQNTENLLVSDRFVLFASGSVAAGDGGIVVQQATQDVGELLGYENGIGRWGFKSAFNAADSSFTAEAYAGTVQVGTGQTAGSTAPIFGGASFGHGTIHVDTDDGEIWIYS